MTLESRHWIGGEWVGSADGAHGESSNPSTGQALGRFADAGLADAESAIGAARETFETSDPAEVVFDVSFRDPHDALAWPVYGGFRTPSLYPGEGAGANERLP